MKKVKPKKETIGIENAIKEINERFGEGSIIKLGDSKKSNVDTISTGSISLNKALGVGGIPRGRIIEIYGPESSGKTTLSLHIIAEAQKMGNMVAFIDAEHALDSEYAEKLGVKVSELNLSQPNSGEEALQIAEILVKSGDIKLIVIDSVAALTPKAEIEGEIGDSHIALQARLMSQALRKLTSQLSKADTTIIFINQIRMNVNTFGYGNPETTPGGRALKFYSSVRIDLRRIAQIKKGDQIIGSRVRAKIVKSKVSAPFKQAEFEIYFNEGISKEIDIVNLGIKNGIVKLVGTTYFYGEEKIGVGIEKSRLHLRENKTLFNKILKEIDKID